MNTTPYTFPAVAGGNVLVVTRGAFVGSTRRTARVSRVTRITKAGFAYVEGERYDLGRSRSTEVVTQWKPKSWGIGSHMSTWITPDTPANRARYNVPVDAEPGRTIYKSDTSQDASQ